MNIEDMTYKQIKEIAELIPGKEKNQGYHSKWVINY